LQLIGILGGAFDPIHFGHLRMAQELADGLGLDEVRFIPTGYPPHRSQPQSDSAHRLAMVRLALEGNSRFSCDEREIRRYAQQQAPSYMLDTLLSLNEEMDEKVALCLLLGGDAFLGLPSWYRWDDLLEHCHIVVAHRPNATLQPAGLPQQLKALWEKSGTERMEDIEMKRNGCLLMQPITALDISATNIRRDLKLGKSPRYLMPDNVIEYIQAKKLYL
jgi:nicotinate-nucleotide adenylyltransferase